MLNNGKLRSMPPKYTTEDKELEIIRPMIQIREQKTEECAKENSFPLIPPDSCPAFTKGVKDPTARAGTKSFLKTLEKENKDLFSKIKTSFTNVQIDTFANL
jgi:tRNA 2-thiocytidine biosynthesis protein TtcA